MQIVIGILIPFLGTTLGALLVFLLRGKLNAKIEKMLLGFAAGVMLAASIWSLIDPAISMSENLGKFAFFTSSCGIYDWYFVYVFIGYFGSSYPHKD